MEIYLADEHAYQLTPLISLEVARDRIDKKKMSLVAGTVGALFSQPKPDEIKLVATENRLEPFWFISASTHTEYDRACAYVVPVTGPEVKGVTLFGQRLNATVSAKGPPTLSLTGIEHCAHELRSQQTFDAISGAKADFIRFVKAERVEIAELSGFAPEGVLVVPPQVRATAVVRQVTAEVVQPVQNAHAIHSERVDLENIDLIFRPVYALEYEWAAKNKRVVVEFDAVGGEMRGGGKRLADQIRHILTRDVLFDVTADAIGMIVPGGNIAVKLVKAVVDRGKRQ